MQEIFQLSAFTFPLLKIMAELGGHPYRESPNNPPDFVAINVGEDLTKLRWIQWEQDLMERQLSGVSGRVECGGRWRYWAGAWRTSAGDWKIAAPGFEPGTLGL
jgi:hypothetical protein